LERAALFVGQKRANHQSDRRSGHNDWRNYFVRERGGEAITDEGRGEERRFFEEEDRFFELFFSFRSFFFIFLEG
jgi:hypothetical protein